MALGSESALRKDSQWAFLSPVEKSPDLDSCLWRWGELIVWPWAQCLLALRVHLCAAPGDQSFPAISGLGQRWYLSRHCLPMIGHTNAQRRMLQARQRSSTQAAQP